MGDHMIDLLAVASDLAASFLTSLGTSAGKRALELAQGPAAGGTPDQRFAVYERLRRECVAIRTTLDVLWSVPLRFPGVAITLPLHVRLVHRLPQQGAEVNDAFLAVAMVGARDVVTSAMALAEALQGVTPPKTRGSRRPAGDRGRPDWAEFDAALQAFVVSCRRDLAIEVLPDKE